MVATLSHVTEHYDGARIEADGNAIQVTVTGSGRKQVPSDDVDETTQTDLPVGGAVAEESP